jgi:hypothetical protein
MYTILVIFWPCMGSVFAIASILVLLLGKDAADRKKALAELGAYRGRDLVFCSSTKSKAKDKDAAGTRRRIHVEASSIESGERVLSSEHPSILHAVSEAVGADDASDEEAFVSSARLIV